MHNIFQFRTNMMNTNTDFTYGVAKAYVRAAEEMAIPLTANGFQRSGVYPATHYVDTEPLATTSPC